MSRRPRPILAVWETRWQRQRARPPRCPRHWKIGPPDFVGVGTHKSGTSWWYRLIRKHPGVVTRGHPKELRYFSRFADTFTATDAAGYARWFPRPEGKLAGEWSPLYGDDRSTARMLAAAAPDARLLTILRDPIARFRSDMTMLGDIPRVEARAVRRGAYSGQIANLCQFFPREQLLVLQYERCIADLPSELARTYRFLGLDESFTPLVPRRSTNVTRGPLVSLSEEQVQGLTSVFEPEVLGLADLVPDLDLSLWPSMRHLA